MATGSILAIDLGTSGPKVALVDRRGRVRASGTAPTSVRTLPGGGAEQDPDAWWAAIVTATRRCLASGDGASVEAVAVTSQWSGTVAVDGKLRPLRPAIIWMDTRGRAALDRRLGGPLRIAGYGPARLWRWIDRTGGAPGRSGKDALAHVLYLADEEPDVYRRAAYVLEPKDYLNARLTGRVAAGYDSIALHWVTDNRDAAFVRYDDELVAMVGLDASKLPPLRPATSILGPLHPQAAADLGLASGTPVAMGTPDVHAAALGAAGGREFEAHLYLGTSSWCVAHVPFKKTDLLHNMASLPSALPGRYLLLDEQETAGGALTFLRDRILFAPEVGAKPPPDDLLPRLDALAAEVPVGAQGLSFLPWLYGERTPVEDARLRGGFVGLGLDHGPGHLARAVLEGVAFNGRWLVEAVESFCGRGLPHLRLAGGGARSALWAQIHADVLHRPIDVVEDPVHVGVRGVAGLAWIALGATTPDAWTDEIPIARRILPDEDRAAVYDGLYAEFRRAHRFLAARARRVGPSLSEDAP
ncbi:MAG: xylulose kinase [Deltaproteobacteria bacterium]|nr:MAG: xylulose kinase [Deltaproteobacteria bacterium]